jgi:hypothetical protein
MSVAALVIWKQTKLVDGRQTLPWDYFPLARHRLTIIGKRQLPTRLASRY